MHNCFCIYIRVRCTFQIYKLCINTISKLEKYSVHVYICTIVFAFPAVIILNVNFSWCTGILSLVLNMYTWGKVYTFHTIFYILFYYDIRQVNRTNTLQVSSIKTNKIPWLKQLFKYIRYCGNTYVVLDIIGFYCHW